MVHAVNASHIGSCLSMADILAVLYTEVLRLDPTNPANPDRDRFILSKGHATAILYAALAERGFFPAAELDTYCRNGSALTGHVSHGVPGVEASTGSLGHGLALAVGSALGLRARGSTEQRVVVLCGDAELNEGSNWESVLLAPYLNLTNLTLLVIDNHSSSIPMGPWEARLGSFGWDVDVVDGHDHEQLFDALSKRPSVRPNAVVADIPEGEW